MPAFGYRTTQVELTLSEDELLRLMRHDLRPEEVKQLIQTHGVFHEVHDDFYDPQTFEALQPTEAVEPSAQDSKPSSERLR